MHVMHATLMLCMYAVCLLLSLQKFSLELVFLEKPEVSLCVSMA